MDLNIGLVGRKRTGKDTVADHLVERHGYTKMAFADPLRDLAWALDPIVNVSLSHGGTYRFSDMVSSQGYNVAKEKYPEIRQTLQRLGNGARDVLGEDVWVRAFMQRFLSARSPVVVTDVRYANEAGALRQCGFLLVRLSRPSVSDGDAHVSETGVDRILTDACYTNEGTLAELYAYIESVMNPPRLSDRPLIPTQREWS